MSRKISYAGVTATLALIIAMSGTSYAALKITGQNVVDHSLTGKDIKKHSVPLNRLKGQLPHVDPSLFVPAAGVYEVTVGPVEWQSDSTTLLPRTFLGYNQVQFTSTSASGSSVLHLNPTLPGTLAGRAMRLRAATICWDASAANLVINSAYVSASRGSLDGAGGSVAIGEIQDEDAEYNDRTCKRYAIDPGFDLGGGGLVSIRLIVVWQAVGAKIKLAGTTLELERT